MNNTTTMPRRDLLLKIADCSNKKRHTEADTLIAKWVMTHTGPRTSVALMAKGAYFFCKGLETIHNEMGYVVPGLYEERDRITTRLLEALRRVNPGAATMFYGML